MFKSALKLTILILTVSMLVNCANRGTPSGGEKDIEPPKVLNAVPENFSTNFTGDEIRIYFDEYIKLKKLQLQLIISPPMNNEPVITPLGAANKYIKIKILDTLQPNTTYAFNFGQSIVDNNEENPYPYYRYVFSTGNYIDSLYVKGRVLDAKNRKPDTFVSVMLYEVDSTFTDSIIYKKKPKYITNTLDSLTTFSIDNIKAGKYLLVALKDENSNFTYQQKSDKVGFYDTFVTIPADTASIHTIKLFKEELDFKVRRPKQAAGQKIIFPFEGNHKGLKIKMLQDTLEAYAITKEKKADTLYYWYKPKIELDSTLFAIQNKTYKDTLTHRFRSLEKDSLIISPLQSGTLNFNEDFSIEGSIPFTKIDEKKITILDKDSLQVSFKTAFDSIKNTYAFQFKKEESDTYRVQILPEALTDFFDNTNDTLNFVLRTKLYSDYGNARITLINAKYPVIVQLTNDKDEVKYEQFADEPQLFDFRHLDSGDYYLRVVFDENGNQKWDSGNYLKKQKPERISYDPKFIEVRSNWDNIKEFTLE